MMFSFRQKEKKGFIKFYVRHGAFNGNDQLLPDNIGNKVFLSRIDMTSLPENTDLFQERKNDLYNCAFNTFCSNIISQYAFKLIHIQACHFLDKLIGDTLLYSFCLTQ